MPLLERICTGKDNLLNAWRTPYGASIFQVHSPLLLRLSVQWYLYLLLLLCVCSLIYTLMYNEIMIVFYTYQGCCNYMSYCNHYN